MNGKRKIASVCVYCASSSQVNEVYISAANILGQLLARNQISCINGAGKMGLMGELNSSVLANGGKAIGIIPQFMVENGWHHPSLSEMHITANMHERKQLMATMADAFVALPGGIGTLEELIEIITWKQLGLHRKPIVILNVNGIYTPLLQQLKLMATEQFMRELHTQLYQVANTPEEVLHLLENGEEWSEDYSKFAAL